MIKIQRGAAPIGFAEQSSLWQQEFQQQTNTATHFWNLVRKRKAMKQYAQALAERFHHKCCFCEIDPANEDPTDHIEFLEAQILARTNRGGIIIKQIRLNRSDLLRERQQWLLTIDNLLLLLLHLPSIKQAARTLLIWALQDDAPYTALTRSYLAKWTPKLANPETPHPPVQLDNPLAMIRQIIEKHRQQLQEVM